MKHGKKRKRGQGQRSKEKVGNETRGRGSCPKRKLRKRKAKGTRSFVFVSGALAALQHPGVRAARVHLFVGRRREREKES